DGRAGGLTEVYLYRPPSMDTTGRPLDKLLREDADTYLDIPCTGATSKSVPGDYQYSRECMRTSATPTVEVAVYLVGARGVAAVDMVVWNEQMSADEARTYAETTA